MNKKYIILGLPILFLVLVVATVTYYALFSTTFTVISAIEVRGAENFTFQGNVIGGEPFNGNVITITNIAPSERIVSITDNSGDDVVVEYNGIFLNKESLPCNAVENVRLEWNPSGDECNDENSWCEGADTDKDGDVDATDLAKAGLECRANMSNIIRDWSNFTMPSGSSLIVFTKYTPINWLNGEVTITTTIA